MNLHEFIKSLRGEYQSSMDEQSSYISDHLAKHVATALKQLKAYDKYNP